MARTVTKQNKKTILKRVQFQSVRTWNNTIKILGPRFTKYSWYWTAYPNLWQWIHMSVNGWPIWPWFLSVQGGLCLISLSCGEGGPLVDLDCHIKSVHLYAVIEQTPFVFLVPIICYLDVWNKYMFYYMWYMYNTYSSYCVINFLTFYLWLSLTALFQSYIHPLHTQKKSVNWLTF